MSSVLKSRAVKAAVLALGQFTAMCTAILIGAVLTRVFSETQYAVYQKTFLAFNIVVPLLTFGIPLALYYFIPRRKDASRAVVTENLLILSAGAIGFSLFILLGGNEVMARQFQNPALASSLMWLVPFAFFELYSRSVGPCLMAHDQAHLVAIYNVVTRLFVMILGISAAFLFATTTAVIVAMVIAAGIRLLIGFALMWQATRGTRGAPTMSGVTEQLRYGIPLGIAGVFGTLTLTMDKFIVASLCSNVDFAIYAVGAFEIPLVGIITGSVTAVLLADLSTMFTENKKGEAVGMWGRAAEKVAMLLFPVMVGLFVIAPEVITLLFSEKYAKSVLPFRLYLLLVPMRIVNYGSMIMSAGRSKLILLRAAVAFALNIVLSIVLTRSLGYVGAIIATILVSYLWSVPFNLIVISRLWSTPVSRLLPWGRLAATLGLAVAACPVLLIDHLTGTSSRWLVLGVLSPLYAGLMCAALIQAGLLPHSFPRMLFRKIRQRIRRATAEPERPTGHGP